MNNGREQKPKKKPIFSVFTVAKRNGRDIWKDHGVTFAHKSPEEGEEPGIEALEGMNLILDFFGQEVKLILLPYKEPQRAETPDVQGENIPDTLVVQ